MQQPLAQQVQHPPAGRSGACLTDACLPGSTALSTHKQLRPAPTSSCAQHPPAGRSGTAAPLAPCKSSRPCSASRTRGGAARAGCKGHQSWVDWCGKGWESETFRPEAERAGARNAERPGIIANSRTNWEQVMAKQWHAEGTASAELLCSGTAAVRARHAAISGGSQCLQALTMLYS